MGSQEKNRITRIQDFSRCQHQAPVKKKKRKTDANMRRKKEKRQRERERERERERVGRGVVTYRQKQEVI